jgi:hypothetical protein
MTVKVLMEESNQSKPAVSEIERTFSYRKTIILIRLREVLPASELEFFVANDEVARIVQSLEMGLPTLSGVGMAARWRANGQDSFKRASLLVSASAPLSEGLQDRV